jgi:hypothetical protein
MQSREDWVTFCAIQLITLQSLSHDSVFYMIIINVHVFVPLFSSHNFNFLQKLNDLHFLSN